MAFRWIGYNGLSGRDTTIPLYATPFGGVVGGALIESHHAMHFIDFNSVFKTPGNAKFGAYGIAGGGFYYRSISLTTPDVGYTTYCDPYWYVCYPTVVSIDQVMGTAARGTRHRLRRGRHVPAQHLDILLRGDALALHVGPSFVDGQGIDQKANGWYFPLTFGFRF